MEDDSDSVSVSLSVGSEWLRGGANDCAAERIVAQSCLNIGQTAALYRGHLPYIKAIALH